MPGPVFLRGDGVDLRTVEREDLDFVSRVRNDPRVRQRFPSAVPKNQEALESYFEERVTDTDNGVRLLVVPDGGDDPVGFVSLQRLDSTHGTAALGAWIAPEKWGEGYATAGGRALVEYAFTERRLERLTANALATNEGSLAVIRKLGFVEEGRKREAFHVNGERVDLVHHGLLREEWE
jgi:diamine N-acetyltransferase